MRRLQLGGLNDLVLRVRDEGDSPKTPVICIHGAGASSVVWMDTVRRLAPRRRVVALDLPGHGQSDRWHHPSVEMYRDAVGTVCAALGIAKAILVGHSLGGLIALSCAAAWPERVAGLLTVGAGLRLPVSERVFERLRDYATFPAWLAGVAWSPATPKEIVERWSGLMVTAEADVTTADFRAAAAFDGRGLGKRVRCPTLVLGGGDDLLTPASLSCKLGDAILGATVEILPRAGHMLHLEHPDAFHAHLDNFLATL